MDQISVERRTAARRRAVYLGSSMLVVVACAAAAHKFQIHSPRQVYDLARFAVSGECPPGTRRVGGDVETNGEREGAACLRGRGFEPAHERVSLEREFSFRRGVPAPGAMQAAVAQKAVLSSEKAQVAGAGGIWEPHGGGPVIANDPRYGAVNGEGLAKVAGRIDTFDFDPVARRLFASVGNGGVWMSEDLAQNWVSIGDTLPSQTIGAVGWSSAGGGTVVALGGEPSMGGGTYVGLGAFWSNNLGQSWTLASGVPDGIMGFKVAVDHADPNIVYLGTSKGLYRSTDAGRSYSLISLPVGGGCDGRYDGECQFANFVTDVIVKEPGGATDEAGGQVLAAVGYRAGNTKLYPDGKPHSPGNGLYFSATGAAGTFAKLDIAAPDSLLPNGFAAQDRTGRIALGPAIGAEQDHNIVYAMVEDAVLFNGGFPLLDLPEALYDPTGLGGLLNSSLFNGLYVSLDFGQSWTRMADTLEIIAPGSGSALLTQSALGYAPGVQAYYNLWVHPDPTRTLDGVPTRLVFGLEEVWMNRLTDVPLNGTLQAGPGDFMVIGDYFAGETCGALSLGLPACPLSNEPLPHTTTHPDQHAGVFILDTDGSGGVTLIVGNDGGAYAQHVDSSNDFANDGWGDGANDGFNTTLPYGIAAAKDGVVWFGLQDNGSGKVDTDGQYYMTYGGDGFYAAVDPDNSDVAYTEYTYGDIRVTQDGGQSWSGIAPSLTGAMFGTVFVMDPLDANHLMTGGQEIVERLQGPDGSWTEVFNLGTAASGATNVMSTLDVHGDAAYVGFCGVCDILNHTDEGFHSGIATNVGGDAAPQKGSSQGWHIATAAGLPNRYISGIDIDPQDPNTVYVALAGYANRQWVVPGSYLDSNADIGSGHVYKSTDAGETFTDISGELPDVPFQAVTVRNGQVIVGTDIGAFISSDTDGSHWSVLGAGLPSTPITWLQRGPGDDTLLYASVYGRGVYRYRFADAGTDVGGGTGGTDAGRFGSGAAAPASLLLLLAMVALRMRRRIASGLAR
ncbi:hypothetical protein E4T66_18855 [Sinimarinibacterium sp. CAU 1509]|uniref:WD40/YVTN/BNR-like repeat-containing protein n=1 Tax=Sinimarinibacterium sp. CAU 1509 TaxID=2562283 RepID=UPI0010AD1A4A|nr:hypothetical protein [Sinimarinibacterium sp. CAU 1509]TJY56625.1 hypothetical protein E4T66_18855 [Sinimarinibacterium sp. CAU 1509]